MTKRDLTWAEQAYPPVGEFVEIEGHQVHYVDQGSGPAVILIHGASGNLRDWTFSMTERLATSYRVLAFDRAGHGYSSRPEDGYDPAVQGRLIAKAARRVGVEKALLVGTVLAAHLRWPLRWMILIWLPGWSMLQVPATLGTARSASAILSAITR